MSDTRTLRWMGLMWQILIVMFVDTLFFGIFYPDDGNCEQYLTRRTCEASMNMLTNAPVCKWHRNVVRTGTDANDISINYDIHCTLASPPNEFFFQMLLSGFTLLIALPLTFCFEYIRSEICNKRPDVSKWGWNVLYWLGPATYDLHSGKYKSYIPIKYLPKTTTSNVSKSTNDKTNQQSDNFNNKAKGMGSSVALSRTLLANPISINDSYQQIISHLSQEEIVYLSRMIFMDSLTPREASLVLVQDVRQYLASIVNRTIHPIFSNTEINHRMLTLKEGKYLMIRRSLGLDSSGNFLPISLRKRLLYGSGLKRIEIKLERAIKRAKQIKVLLHAFRTKDIQDAKISKEESSRDEMMSKMTLVEISMLQYFVLEQLPPFQRFLLRSQCFTYQFLTPEKIHPMKWLCGWLFLIFTICFFIYWIYVWALTNGNRMYAAWGWNFFYSIIQDILLVQMMKVYVYYAIMMKLTLPYLYAIYQVILQKGVEILMEAQLATTKAIVQQSTSSAKNQENKKSEVKVTNEANQISGDH